MVPSARDLGFCLALVCCAAAGSPTEVFAQKNTAVANAIVSLPADMTAVSTASLEKGKAKRILVVNATLTAVSVPDFTYCDLSILLTANGVSMDSAPMAPFTAKTTCDCNPSECIGCTLSATTTLDLDAAETASPGSFQGQPIDVVLAVDSSGTCQGQGAIASLVVQMAKK